MAEKTEKPTPRRLRDAARRGQVLKSHDLGAASVMLAGVLALSYLVDLQGLLRAWRSGLALDGAPAPLAYALALALGALRAFVPLWLACLLAGTLPALLLSRFALASKALQPRLSALSPLQGWRRIFSLRNVKNGVKTLLVLGAGVGALWLLWRHGGRLLFAALHGQAADLQALWMKLLLDLVVLSMASVALILMLDLVAESWLHARSLKMERHAFLRDLRDEEGRPETKGRRNWMYQEALSDAVRADIAGSELVLTNPTHVAVGIGYRPALASRPCITVLEQGQAAVAVREHARAIGVPLIRAPALARRLHASHRRDDPVDQPQVEQLLRLLQWLRQVEAAGAGAHGHWPPP